MPVALGQVSRNIYDAAGALLQNKQIETQERIARAAQRGANQRAALGAAQSALGAVNANNQRAKDRQLQQQRDAEQRRLQQEFQRKSRLQQLLDAINKENERWLHEVDRMRQRGFAHNPQQQEQIDAIDRKHDELVDLINEKISQGDLPAAEAVAMQLQNEQKKRWKFPPRTEIPPEFRDIDGQKMMRDANGNWEPVRNYAAEQAEKILKDNQAHADRVATHKANVTKTAADIFQRAYSTGTDYNTAADLEDKHLTSNGLPPTGLPRKSAGDPGYYMNDPNKLSQAEKRLEKDTDYLRSRRDKIMDDLRGETNEKGDLLSSAEIKSRFDQRWKDGGYEALEKRVESERSGGTQAAIPGAQAAEAEIPQDVRDAANYLDQVTNYLDQLESRGQGVPNPAQLQKYVTEAKSIVEKYETQNPGRLSTLPVSPQRGTQAQQGPVGPPQARGVPQPAPQVAPQQAPQAAQPPVPAEAAPQGPFKRGNFLNGPRSPQTSSLGGGGLGGLAMMGDPLSGLYERGETAQAPRDRSLATAPDARSNASGGVEDQAGFLEKMQAWLERNPAPSASYFPAKGTTNPNQSAYPTYQRGGRVYGGDLPAEGVPEGQYRLEKTLGDVQSRSQSGYQSAGSAIPGLRGTSAVAPTLNPSVFNKAVSELDDWERANPGHDVGQAKQALSQIKESLSQRLSSFKPEVFADGVPLDPVTGKVPWAQELTPKQYIELNAMDRAREATPKRAGDLVSQSAITTKRIAEELVKKGANPDTAVKAAQQIAKANALTGGKLLSGLGSASRSVGGLGNVLTMLGWVGAHAQDSKQFLDQQFRDWAVKRMAAENNQADQFGIPRAVARDLSSRLDGYTKGLDQRHLSEMRARADKIVPPVPQSQSPTSTPSSVATKSRPQTPQMTVSPFAFVNENTLRQKIWDEYSRLWDKLPARFVTDKEQQGLRDQQSEIEAKAKAAETDRTNYPWPKYLDDVSRLAESWARAKGYEGPKGKAHDELMKFAETTPDIGKWDRPQPDFTKPNGLNDWEWKKLSSDINKTENQSFFGPHIDKPGSYLRQEGSQRYNPDASRQQSNQNQIQVSRDAGGNVQLTNGAGQTKRIETLEGRSLFPNAQGGPSSEGRTSTLAREAADRQAERDKLESEAVKFYGLSGNGQHPTEDGKNASEAVNFTARTKTIQLNDTMQSLDAKGELPPSLLEFPEKFPEWVTRLPAAKWTDKEGKEHYRNDVPTDEEGLQNLVNEISKSKGIGKYAPEAKAAENAGQEGEQPAAEADAGSDQAPLAANALAPEMQEYHLRSPKPPSRESFEQGIRDQGGKPQPGEYEDFLKAREEVRSRLPKSAELTPPGNLFLDKDGKLKESDGKNGKPYPKDRPLPPGYNQLVPQPGRQPLQGQQPPRGQPQAAPPRELQPLDIARGAAAARRNQAAEDARSPRQQALDRLDRAKQQEIRDFFQPPPIQQRIAPRPLDRKDFQVPPLGVPAGAGIQGRASFTPTFDDFSSQGQFPQQQFPSLGLGSFQPDYNNAIASSGFSPQYLPSSQSFQPQYQPQYAQPSFDQPFNYYEPPQYQQPYFEPQFDNFSNYQFQPQFEPVNYPSFSFDPYVGGLGNVYSVGGGGDFYGGGYSDGLSYFGDIG